MPRTNMRLSGFGGQGIILAGVITAKAAVEQDGIYATQTQSYGAESRGGACMANVVLSQEKIDYPEPEELDILVAMSHQEEGNPLRRLCHHRGHPVHHVPPGADQDAVEVRFRC